MVIGKLAEKIAGVRIERIDAAIAEVADEQGVAEFAETAGRTGQTPGRVQRAL